jgi:predicted enzyme related to lactoylglutathione lyase
VALVESIVVGQGYVPSDSGPLIYLNGKDLNNVLKVEEVGGRIVMPKPLISEIEMATNFIDLSRK